MPKVKTLEQAYNGCTTDGFFRILAEINIQKIESLIDNAETNINSAKIILNSIDKQAKEWMNVYTLHYEALRIYTEALLQFEKIESTNHQCLFSYLCLKFSDLELNWDFFEKIRTKRHGVNYYGEQINYEDWKAVEVQINLYLSTLRKELETKIANF